MERKENRLPIFTERFRSLQGDRTNTEFADFLGLSRQTVGFYCNGDRLPDVVTLKQIAGKCGVTTDWLLGHNTPSTEADVCIACAVTGLSREAILKLKNLPDNSSYDYGALHHFSQNVEEENAEGEIHRCLGELLCSPTFIELIAQICRYKDSCEASELLLDAGLSADTCAVAEQINKDSSLPLGVRDEALLYYVLFSNDGIAFDLLSDDPHGGIFSPLDLYEYRANRELSHLLDEIKASVRNKRPDSVR